MQPQRPSAAVSRRRRFRLARTFVVFLTVIATGWWLAGLTGDDNGPPTTSSDPHASRASPAGTSASGSSDRGASSFASAAWLPAPSGRGHLAPGSDPSVLPGPILIADKRNNRLLIVDPRGRVRWRFPRRGDLPRGRTFQIPDDAFFSPDGQRVVFTAVDEKGRTPVWLASLNGQTAPFLIVHWKHTLNLISLVDVIPGDRAQVISD